MAGLCSFVYKTEDGRELDCIDETKPIIVKTQVGGVPPGHPYALPMAPDESLFIRNLLIRFFTTTPIAFRIRRLRIEIVNGDSVSTTMSYNFLRDTVKVPLLNLRSRLSFVKKYGEREEDLVHELGGELAHECAHKLRNELTEYARLRIIAEDRLSESLKKLAAAIPQANKKGLADIAAVRELLFWACGAVQDEGLAVLAQRETKGLNWSDGVLKSLYEKAAGEASKFFSTLMLGLEKRKIDPNIVMYKNGVYDLGEHMAYAILFLDKEASPESLAKMHLFRFIELYEQVMEKHGLRPIFSLTSGKGVWDYKRLLQQFSAALKKL